jgi:hypothetical protein
MLVNDAVNLAWRRLTRWGYDPHLVTAREALRLTGIAVEDTEAFRRAWDARGGYGLQTQTDPTKGAR